MGYSRNPQTLVRRIELYETLIKGEACAWEIPEGSNINTLAYQLREGLFIAAMYPNLFPELAAVSDKFRIEIVSPTVCQARPVGGGSEARILNLQHPTTNMGLEPGPTQLTVAPRTAEDIINLMLTKQPTNEKQTFLYASLSEVELYKLWKWASAQTPAWLMFVANEGTITLTRYTRDIVDYAWAPEDIGLEGSNAALIESKEEKDPPGFLSPQGMDLDIEDR